MNAQNRIIRAVCGLGNPGEEYALSRHNLGFIVTDRLAAVAGARTWRKECAAKSTGRFTAWGRDLIIFQPQTYMNLSGESILALARHYALDAGDILIVHDDADLPFGKLRLRARGGSGGHRGLQSALDSLGTDDFPRLRLGVANESRGRRIHDFVLDRFTAQEEEMLGAFLDAAVEAIQVAVRQGLTTAMNRFNRSQDRPSP